MVPQLDGNRNVRAYCDRCAAVTTFEHKTGGSHYGSYRYNGNDGVRMQRLYRCSGCDRGGLGELGHHYSEHENDLMLLSFFPTVQARLQLPTETPNGVRAEFDEAATCADAGAYRGGSALLRSVLEKVLKANGYTSGSLVKKIDDAADDGVITSARKKRAHANIRTLGNDVVHDDWRPVDQAEFALAYEYVHRIIEDFYEHRDEVVRVLIESDRLPEGASNGDSEMTIQEPST